MHEPGHVLRVTDNGMLVFYCPGCRELHGVWTKEPNPMTGAKWTWNGDLIKPTFSPSIVVNGKPKCHSFVRAGMIEYLNDCEHGLAGKTVPLPAEPLNQN